MLQRIAILCAGVVSLLSGGCFLLFLYGFGSLVNPELSAAEQYRETARRMLVDGFPGVVLGLALVLAGASLMWQAVRRSAASKHSVR